jgi:hypothetical protein
MLTELLKKHPAFQELPLHEQEIFAKLATVFQESTDNLFKSPEELEESTGIGNRFQWARLLAFEPTKHYIESQMAQITQIAHRKAFLSLQKEATLGNVQAVKHINELSGIMENKDNNKIIVLHQIERPQVEQEESS